MAPNGSSSENAHTCGQDRVRPCFSALSRENASSGWGIWDLLVDTGVLGGEFGGSPDIETRKPGYFWKIASDTPAAISPKDLTNGERVLPPKSAFPVSGFSR